MIPQDPMILLSFLNTQLRDYFPSLEDLCATFQLDQKEIEAKMDEIIAFSELGKYIDKPVKSYSSGMHSRLAFAITAILDTEILLIDEIFSVGDARFKKKSNKKMKQLIMDRDRTVIMISHSIETLRSMCDRIIWLHQGEIKMTGKPDEVLDKYNEFMVSGVN